MSAYEDAAATLLAKFKLSKEKGYYYPRESSVMMKPDSSGRRHFIKPIFTKVQRRHQSIKHRRTD